MRTALPDLEKSSIVKHIAQWIGLVLALTALLALMGSVGVKQLDLATSGYVRDVVSTKVEPIQERVRTLENLARKQDIVNRCLVWHVDPDTCERALGQPLPKPGGNP